MKSLLPILALLVPLAIVGAAESAPYHLIDNFSRPLPSGGEARCQVVPDDGRPGLGVARVDYELAGQQRRAHLWVDRQLPGRGRLTLWVEGDPAAEHDIQLVIWHARVVTDAEGRVRHENRRDEWLNRVPIDFSGWRELAFDMPELPDRHQAWLRGIVFHARGGSAPAQGTVRLDDLRLHPAAGRPLLTMQHGLLGPAARPFSADLDMFLDLHNFRDVGGRVQVRVSMTDRHENPVYDHDFALDVPAAGRQEFRLPLAPENLHLYLPPFRIRGDILSLDLPAATDRFDYPLVMGNAYGLWEDFGNPQAHWLAAGWESPAGFNVHSWRNWLTWLMGETQRVTTITQTQTRIRRLDLEAEATAGPDGQLPPGRFALRWDYQDNAELYNARPRIPRQPGDPLTGDRFLPGNAYRVGFWVRGDGSGALLQAIFLDYTDLGQHWAGGWKRTYDGTRTIGRLDFEGWRYLEVDLPGNGLGSNERNGSTDSIDFPLELTALRIQSWRDDNERQAAEQPAFAGTVLLGPIFVHTQQPAADALFLHLGYADPELHYAPEHDAWYQVFNGCRHTARSVATAWTLLDRDDQAVASGVATLPLEPGQAAGVPVKLAELAAELAGRPAPYRLRVTAFDQRDAATTATRELIVARPDSLALVADFEEERGYFAYDQGAKVAAVTTTDQAKSGRRALAIDWTREAAQPLVVAIDPPLPGAASEVTMWVHGDGAGSLFYPVFGGARGVSHGSHNLQFNLLLGRHLGGDLDNAVRVDWQGWREVRFRLPPVPPSWDKLAPVWGFIPTYPQSLQLAIDARTATADAGRLLVDDIRVHTHLPAGERLDLAIQLGGTANVLPPGGALQLLIDNHEPADERQAEAVVEVTDWRGQVVATLAEKLALAAGQRRRLVFNPKLPTGAYSYAARLVENGLHRREIHGQFMVADLRPALGDQWPAALRDEWQLRQPLGALYTFIPEDWDWLEHYPGNFQTESARRLASQTRRRGAEPWLLLGYSAYYAAGIGFEEFQANSFRRRLRNIGHDVDLFHLPARLADWDNYVYELMRGAGEQAAGWILWNNPDARGGPLAVPPERFAELLASADKWRRVYCPDQPLLIGGMTMDTAIPYLRALAELDALRYLSGINIRLDVGTRSPEDAEVFQYLLNLRQALAADGVEQRQILLTDLDWAVERRAGNLDEFDQAAYLMRAALLLAPLGVRPEVDIRNSDYARLGVGLAYRDSVSIPPHNIRLPELRLKAGWLGLAHTRQWLDQLAFASEIEVADRIPQRSRALLFAAKDGRAALFVWRNNDPGQLSFARTGLAVAQAEDLLGSPLTAVDGHYPVGKLPVLFLLDATVETATVALRQLWVGDDGDFAWPQRVLAAWAPGRDQAPSGYQAEGAQVASLAGQTTDGRHLTVDALVFAAGGRETLTVELPAGSGLVLHKRYLLDEHGQLAEVWLDGQSIGTWDLRRSDPLLSAGFRDAIFLIGAEQVAGKTKPTIEIRYPGPANSVAWRIHQDVGGSFPLTAVGAVHVDQVVSHPRLARNMAGERLRIGDQNFADGLGVFAPCLIEIDLNGQFRQFTTQFGIDAATEGRGSVVFEIHGDGRRLWQSPLTSGLDEARQVKVDVAGVNRLRLVVTDGGDGNSFDAANLADAHLLR